MGGLNKPNQLNQKQEKIKSILETQKLIKSSMFDKWCVKIYWGQLPTVSEVTQLGFSGYAITDDINNACAPDLTSSDGTQVVVGERSVIIWSAGSEEELGEKIKHAFKLFKWRK